MLGRFKFYPDIFERQQLKILYYAFVQSHINYGITEWGGVSNNYLNKLEYMQKWILKIIYKTNYTYSTDSLFNETQVLDTRHLFFQNLVIRHFKYKTTKICSAKVYRRSS